MNAFAAVRRRVIVWSWRARYWWLDTRSGFVAQGLALVLAAIVFLVQTIWLMLAALVPQTYNRPLKSYGGIELVILIIILLISAYAAYRASKRSTQANAQDANVPTTEDGQAVTQIFGTVWISDEFVLAFKVISTEAIKR